MEREELVDELAGVGQEVVVVVLVSGRWEVVLSIIIQSNVVTSFWSLKKENHTTMEYD